VEPSRPELLYVGKLSAAKGVMVLLDALERLAPRVPGLRLHVVGSGEGPETETIRARMARMGPLVVAHGQIAQAELAEVMRRATVCVLPSFYEGVPLVLVEAVASGCRLVATALPGVVEELAPHLAFALDLVPLPRMLGVDAPHPAGLPDLVSALDVALGRAIAGPPVARDPAALARALAPFTWAEVFRRVSEVWRDLLGLG
jgi:glycosyltransferase involved in cell wall biosynthesis